MSVSWTAKIFGHETGTGIKGNALATVVRKVICPNRRMRHAAETGGGFGDLKALRYGRVAIRERCVDAASSDRDRIVETLKNCRSTAQELYRQRANL